MKTINLIVGKQASGKTSFAKDVTKGKLTACIDCSKYLPEDVSTTMRIVPDVEVIIIDSSTINESKMIYDISMWLIAIETEIEIYFIFQLTSKELPPIFKSKYFSIFDIDYLNLMTGQIF